MNASRYSLLGLLVVVLLVGPVAAQGADPTGALPPGGVGPGPAPTPLQTYVPNDGAAPIDHPGFLGGVGMYLMQPFFQDNLAYTVFVEKTSNTTMDPANPNTSTLAETANRVDVHEHTAAAPLIWLGYMDDDGFGGRVRFYTFREGTSQTINLPPFAGLFSIGTAPGPPPHPVITSTGSLATVSSAAPLGLLAFGDTLSIMHGPEATSFNVSTELSLQVIDAEAFQGFHAAAFSFLLSGGVRLLHMEQTYNAYDAQSGGAAELRSLLSSYEFNGAGPTVSLETRRSLGDTGLGMYSIGRGSVVFGSATQNATFFGQELRNDDPNPQYSSEHRERALPIGELELGVEYGRNVGRTWLFGQIGVIGQEWFGAGSSSRSSNATVLTTVRPVLGGAPLDSNIAFLGLSLRLGLGF